MILLRKTLSSHLSAAQTGPITYEQPCKFFIWRHGFTTLKSTAAIVKPNPKGHLHNMKSPLEAKELDSRNRPLGAETSKEASDFRESSHTN